MRMKGVERCMLGLRAAQVVVEPLRGAEEILAVASTCFYASSGQAELLHTPVLSRGLAESLGGGWSWGSSVECSSEGPPSCS